jgi:hypothetical protein
VPRKPEVFSISSVNDSLSTEQTQRSRRYLISMGFRMVTFVAAIVTDGWLRWTLLSASLVLPWVAVVIANAGRESGRRSSTSGYMESGKELL